MSTEPWTATHRLGVRLAANQMIASGYAVEPCRVVLTVDPETGKRSKDPKGLRSDWQRSGYTDATQFARRLEEIDGTGYLIVCGPPSGCTVADLDLSRSHADAITCHKAQGGQWGHVHIAERPAGRDARRWLYTAVTRAQTRLTIGEVPS